MVMWLGGIRDRRRSNFREVFLLLQLRAWSNRDHKVQSGRGADIPDPVLFVGGDKPDRSRFQTEFLVLDRQFYRPFPYEPHFRVGMMMRCGRGRAARRQRGLMHFDALAGSQLSP